MTTVLMTAVLMTAVLMTAVLMTAVSMAAVLMTAVSMAAVLMTAVLMTTVVIRLFSVNMLAHRLTMAWSAYKYTHSHGRCTVLATASVTWQRDNPHNCAGAAC
jgi:uncharacterized membrane protein